MWSYSASRTFRRCQRQWFYRTKLAHHRAKAPLRQEAYLLSKLQSLDAWRGSLVDEIISEEIIPNLKSRYHLNFKSILDEARKRFDTQLNFALNNRIRENGMKPSKALAAFHAIEYGEEISEQEVERAWQDVRLSLSNLFNMNSLLANLRKSNYLVAQRTLTFKHFAGESVQGVPDLIAFYRQEPPIIVDWKVNTFGTQNYRTQLAIYALALARRTTIPSDFPDNFFQYNETDFRLIEVQLLTNQLREYHLTQTDVEHIDSHIASTSMEMKLTKNGKDLMPTDFPTTIYPDNCLRCAFRRLCWEDES